jgi:BioD-like phosphotransacetylase family protein
VLPEDRALLTVSVGELVEHLGGSILNSPERSEELVESIMVGAMSPDPAVSYLSLKQNKAVVTRGDRPDIQLAALQTSTSCLVLTNNINPLPNILSRAKAVKVPVVTVKDDTVRTMEALEGVLDKAKFSHEKKVERLAQLLEQHLDLESIRQAA